MHLKSVSAILAISILGFGPALPILDLAADGAAYAEGSDEGKEKEKGKGKGKEKESGKPVAVDDETLTSSKLGKMNGALNANINAVLAHIKNGQITKGPVGLLAGLAIADAGAAEAVAAAEASVAILEEAEAFDALQDEVEAQGFETVEDYLAAKADGSATQEQIAALDPLVDAAGGTTEDGTALAETEPTAEEIAAAEAAVAAAAEALAQVEAAEAAIIDAWNKDGDTEALIAALRAKLSYNEAEIAAAIAVAKE